MKKTLSFIDEIISIVKFRDSTKDGHDPLIGHLLNLKELVNIEEGVLLARNKGIIIKGANAD